MENTTVLISGAGVAGPALAYWLHRYGCAVTVVERAPGVRPGGQQVDFKGAVHHMILERMGILDAVRARQTGGADQTIVDARGRALAVIPGAFTGGDVEIRRGDLAAILYEHTRDGCEYLFGDTVTALAETDDGVQVSFARAESRRFDIVVGADGIHSAVRRLAFGPERDYVTHHGWYYALAEVGIDGAATMYNEPGRMVALGGPKAPAFFVFAAPEGGYDRGDVASQKAFLRKAYQGGGWRSAEIVDEADAASDFYLDSLSRVDVDRYGQGRVALVGDAAYGNTLAGFGTGLALVGAYVLASELRAAHGDHRVAFRRYQEVVEPYAAAGKKPQAGRFLAPRGRVGIAMRNLAFRSRSLVRLQLWLADRFATEITLPDYPARATD